jgi:hypothetical protein
MQGVIIGLQFSALIPILVFLIYKPSLGLFFKLLLASIGLSILFDVISTSCAYIFHYNMPAICLYCYLNTILITYLWCSVPFYSTQIKIQVRNLGYAFFAIMLISSFFFQFSKEGLYLLSCLNVFLGLILSLKYYYHKITLSSYAPLLEDPYFITASAFILFSLSTIIIVAAQVHFEGQPFMKHTWVLRQTFYFIYNIILAYAFYVLFKIQQIKK